MTREIKISEVIDCLNQGMKRDAVANHFGLTASDTKKLFQHPKLKGLQARKPVAFQLVDDTEDEAPVQQELEAVTETSTDTEEDLN